MDLKKEVIWSIKLYFAPIVGAYKGVKKATQLKKIPYPWTFLMAIFIGARDEIVRTEQMRS